MFTLGIRLPAPPTSGASLVRQKTGTRVPYTASSCWVHMQIYHFLLYVLGQTEAHGLLISSLPPWKIILSSINVGETARFSSQSQVAFCQHREGAASVALVIVGYHTNRKVNNILSLSIDGKMLSRLCPVLRGCFTNQFWEKENNPLFRMWPLVGFLLQWMSPHLRTDGQH